MGDRANVYVVNHLKKETSGVYLYTHWSGSDLPYIVQRALQREQRWNDESYLTRIIFCEMIKGNEAEETGYGIATYRPDNGHPIIVLDCSTQTIGYAKEGAEPTCYRSWSFDEFIKLTDQEISFYEEEE